MTTLQPQTIVIKTLSARTPTTLTVSSKIEQDMLDDLYGDGQRKRRRLTHLSPDEKMLRRKLKNRVAAQTARDRKKNFMSELEEQVALLQEENRKLARENQSLKSESGSLQHENEKLRGRLCQLSGASSEVEAGRSAVSTDLQQRGQTLPVSCLMNTNAIQMLTLSLTVLLACCRQSASPLGKVPTSRSRPRPYPSPLQRPTKQMRAQWWGPQQQSWNPSKN
ncbi:X-box-binding protein 1-like [Mya arenaria]|uniref:X-box-binding protein 1-like n=1 Tax=Mya arenaria TaxID=6604 RepID=UPI0022E10FBB|nr:X-box-binding protein 1-like [Mya arenaria]